MVAKLQSVDFDPRTRTAMHFALGEVDAATWAAIAAAHGDRHLDQIEEWLQTPGFPRQ